MKRRLIFTAVILFVLSVIWVVFGNVTLGLTVYTVASKDLPENFDGYKIAQVSDLHNASIGENNEKLLQKLTECKPDIIAITGDLVDSRRTDTEIALQFVSDALKIAPCYYVTGNHEERLIFLGEFLAELEALGVVVLDDKESKIEIGSQNITIIGLTDPLAFSDYFSDDLSSVIEDKIDHIKSDTDNYTILLSHRPELFTSYVKSDIDLTLSGHAHGGQIRLPLIGGLFAPHQGFFPKYDAGKFTENDTTMIVSRGIGQSIIPVRIGNRPELVLIELKAE